MKIKKVEIQGFKSFVDKVEMTFPPGIVTVVGPNGCGKSNVVDAVRWVLGEQSAKHLRGKLMEDIIFNGSEARKPVGMAEVSLTFDNSDGLAPEEYAEYSDITISRRLFRSGESEYSINKIPSRLKDITELFMGTGVGSKAYSIVEQGKIGAIVTMKPEERRTIIEEAAGITKYKAKKTAAMRKVEATEQNLLRVRDVIREVKRQINSLERQAKKAEKYKALREETRSLELSMASQRYSHIQELLNQEINNLNAHSDEESALTAAIAQKDRLLEENKITAIEAEEVLKEEQERTHRTSNQIVEFEQKISFFEKERGRLTEEDLRYSEEIDRLKNRLSVLDEKIDSLNAELNELTEKEALEATNIQNVENEFNELTGDFQGREGGLEKAKGELVHIITMKSNLQNSLAHLKERLDDLGKRLERKKVEKETAQTSLKTGSQRLSEFETKLRDLYVEKTSIGGSKSTELEKLSNLRVKTEEKGEGIKNLQEELHKTSSKLHSLKELKNSFEGLQTGVQSIMQRHNSSPLTDGVVGIVADFLDVPKDFEIAVGAVLDRKLQYILVKDRDKGLEAINYLKKGGTGRGTFLAPADKARPCNALSWDGEGIPLASKIGIKKGYEESLNPLFHNVLLVSDLKEGLSQWDKGFRGSVVTLDGEVIEESGGITGGKGEAGGFDLLKREREIKELSSTLKIREEEHKTAVKERESLLAQREIAEQGLDELKRKEFAKDMEIANLEKDKASAEKEVERESGIVRIITLEEEQLLSEMKEFENEILSSNKKFSSYEDEEIAKTKEINEANEEIASARERLEKVKEQLTELRVAGASWRERRENLERELNALSSAKAETVRLLDRDEKALLSGKEQAGLLGKDFSEAKLTLDRLLIQHEDLKKCLNDRKNTYEGVATEIRNLETEVRELYRSHDDISKKTASLKVTIAEQEMEIRHLLEGIGERYNVDLIKEYTSIPLPKEGDKEKLESLSRNIEEMGEVNLTALEEHKENLERFSFLEEQEKDLLDAIESLKRAISKINRTSRTRFKEAFDEINVKFQELFPKLFSGGKAKIILTDEEDLLETGVEIVAQPPGKKLQNLNLLSGGEKALTAITLIFSIFLVKPSPFCLLDEVDAPLDDANVGRFNELVKEISRVSQIIMITHNKNSIAIGDTLYGITMEDPGVSNFVSVQLN